MRIATYYSHLNGYEFLKVHKPKLWKEIVAVIKSVDAESCRIKISKEKRTAGKAFYSPIAMNKAMLAGFDKIHWKESRTAYWVTDNARLIRRTMAMPPDEQKKLIESEGAQAIYS